LIRSCGIAESMSWWTDIFSLIGALHPDEADAELVLEQLADRAHAPVAEVVDVVGAARRPASGGSGTPTTR
jgi:hypothetical protein